MWITYLCKSVEMYIPESFLVRAKFHSKSLRKVGRFKMQRRFFGAVFLLCVLSFAHGASYSCDFGKGNVVVDTVSKNTTFSSLQRHFRDKRSLVDRTDSFITIHGTLILRKKGNCW